MLIDPYLFFDGRCREAFDHYERLFGGRITALMTYAEGPADMDVPDAWRDKVMHVRLDVGERVLMGSDAMPGRHDRPQGLAVCIRLASLDRAAMLFGELAEGGEVQMAFARTFWSPGFGACTDRFGTPWMIDVEERQLTMAALTFYTNPNSRGRVVRWMLEEVGQPYETVALAYGPAMKTEDYLDLNPMGKVPTLVHGEQVVTESAAICAYLADAFPDAGLAPPPAQRGAYYRWLFFGAGPLEAAIIDKSLGVGDDRTPQQQGMVGYGNFDTMVEALVRAVSAHEYLAGDRFSAADVYVGAAMGWTLPSGRLPPRPEFFEYFERVSARPAFRRATELDDALAAAEKS